MEEERFESSQNLQQLQDDVSRMTSEVDRLKSQAKRALDEKGELEKQLLQTKQALDVASTTNQHQIAWSEVFPVLQHAQSSLLTTASEVGKMLDVLQNRRNGMYLPGSTIYQDAWASSTAPLPVFHGHPPMDTSITPPPRFADCGLTS
jgi:hypothetical protein